MGLKYLPVQWNKYKWQYDRIFLSGILFYLVVYFTLNKLLFPHLITPTIIIRSFGWLSLILLHIILSIGPLCRINKNFLPLLYNRRHLGVATFVTASVHAILSLFWFHGSGNIHPLLSLFTSNLHYDSLIFFPFQVLGFAGYLILMLMAFTSHDFWLKTLNPQVWKSLHMLVYIAYLLIMMHVALGILQLENNELVFSCLLAGIGWISALHLMAGRQEWRRDRTPVHLDEEHWLYAGEINEIPESRAKVVVAGGERVAIFRNQNRLSAVHNVCKHQLGPLGEGKIIDGCITCPWHGYQYLPHNGCSPAPFTEKVATYALQLKGQRIYVDPRPCAEGTEISPVEIPPVQNKLGPDEFFIGWSNIGLTKQFLKAVRLFTFPALTAGILFIILFTITQKHIAKSYFDYTQPQTVFGSVNLHPFPHLRYIRGKDSYGNPQYAILPVVNANKFGAGDVLKAWCAQQNAGQCQASLSGGIMQRGLHQALELSLGTESINISNEIPVPLGTIIKIADTTLTGEIVDPKCYLGAMNPGEGKPHRSCAIRCISGGIMPVLVWSNTEGTPQYAFLTGAGGRLINDELLFAVGEPVQISGKLSQMDNWYWLELDVANIRRLNNSIGFMDKKS